MDSDLIDTWFLAALAVQPSAERKARAFDIFLQFDRDRPNTLVLDDFLNLFPNDQSLLRKIRLDTAQHLWGNLRYQERENLLRFCSQIDLFYPLIFNKDTLSKIAGAIIEICEHWTWL